jgi:rhodanese-related sulfurtransferase
MSSLINLTPKEGYDILQNKPDTTLIDVRSSMEFLFVGHSVGAIHIAWIDEPDWDINPNFISEVEKIINHKVSGKEISKESPIILICRSGKRSKMAGELLLETGFSNISHIDEGFEGERDNNNQRSTLGGWRFHQLPWEQC